MYKHFIKIALKNMRKNKIYSLINILGLSIGISTAGVIFLFIKTELSYDAYHTHKDSIYRVVGASLQNGQIVQSTYMPGPLGPFLKSEFPQVMNSMRYWGGHGGDIAVDEQIFHQDKIAYIDPSGLEMFTIPFLSGDQETALSEPNSIIMRESIAKKYFGDAEALGQTVYLNDEAFKITGILEDVIHKSHMSYDILIPFAKIEETRTWLQSWGTNAIATYIQLRPGVAQEEFENIFREYLEEIGMSNQQFTFQPLKEIHLHSSHIQPDAFNTNKGSITNIYSFFIIAVLLLIIACINFINLTTAMSAKRKKELGVRKVCGSTRLQIITQVLVESIVVSLISFCVALILVDIGLLLINPLLNDTLTFLWSDYMTMLCVSVCTGLVAGFFPALYHTKQHFIRITSHLNYSHGKPAFMRHVLVLIQFIISITVIAATLVVFNQRDFMLNGNLGFNKDNLLCVQIAGDEERDKIDVLKGELQKDSHIMSIAATTQPTGYGTLSMGMTPVEDPSSSIPMEIGSIDADYIPTMEMRMVTGRNFIDGDMNDLNEGVIINETASRLLGWDDPIGKEFTGAHFGSIDKSMLRVVGVVEDFHFSSFHTEIGPIAFLMVPERYRHLVVRIKNTNTQQTIDHIKTVWEDVLPQSQFNYWFLNEELENQYRTELKINLILTYFSTMIIVISCLGLLGLALFKAEKKYKEIGIRKVVGASVAQVVGLLSKEFLALVLIANIIAWPVSWYVMDKWLQNFAYRIDLGLGVFLLSGGLVLVIALATVSLQAVRAATANPVESLRYE